MEQNETKAQQHHASPERVLGQDLPGSALFLHGALPPDRHGVALSPTGGPYRNTGTEATERPRRGKAASAKRGNTCDVMANNMGRSAATNCLHVCRFQLCTIVLVTDHRRNDNKASGAASTQAKQESKQASRQAGNQANKKARKRESKQAPQPARKQKGEQASPKHV